MPNEANTEAESPKPAPVAPQTQQRRPRAERENHTHLAARTKKLERFRRAGLQFTRDWLIVERADLGAERERAIMGDPELDAMLVTASEAVEMSGAKAADHRTRAELRQAVEMAEKRAEAAEKQLVDLRAKIDAGYFAQPKGQPWFG